MTCDAMLELMLEADLEALAGRGSSPVAMHVRECGRCRAVAEQLVADTRLLAAAVETVGAEAAGGPESRRRVPRGRYLIAGSLAAAALALVVVRPGADDAVRPTVAVPPTATASRRVAAASPARVAASDQAGSPHAGRWVDAPSSPSLVRSALQPFPRAQPVTATRFALPAAEREVAANEFQAVVSVKPPPGMRVAVMRTRAPGLTVVWLY